ncbi:hypothetical protein ACVGOW_24450 [Pseudonocardia saturnea]
MSALKKIASTAGRAAVVAATVGWAIGLGGGPASAEPPTGGPHPTVVAARGTPDPGPPAPAPDPRVTDPGPTTTATPDPRVTNPGPFPVPAPPVTGPVPVPPTTAPPAPAGDAPPPAAPAADGPHAAAPTANLRRLAAALTTQVRGVTAEVGAPAGLGVGPIEISVSWGGRRLTANYDEATGRRFENHVEPRDGAIREEYLTTTLTERVPGGPHHYSIHTPVVVEPLYDITVSEAYLYAHGTCDVPASLNAADPTVTWTNPDGVQRTVDLTDNAGRLSGFAGTWTGVGARRGLTEPVVEWVDRDPGGPIGENALPRGAALLPQPESTGFGTTERRIHLELPDSGGDRGCSASVGYTISYAVVP